MHVFVKCNVCIAAIQLFFIYTDMSRVSSYIENKSYIFPMLGLEKIEYCSPYYKEPVKMQVCNRITTAFYSTHVKRGNYQTFLWKMCLVAKPDAESPDNHDWRKTDSG